MKSNDIKVSSSYREAVVGSWTKSDGESKCGISNDEAAAARKPAFKISNSTADVNPRPPVQRKVSKTRLTNDSIHAERFIPRHKQRQWDDFPSLIIASSACPQMNSISKVHQWVHDPESRRSSFDLCTFNLMNYFPDCTKYLQNCFFQRETPTFPQFILQSYSKSLNELYRVAQNNQNAVKKLEHKISNFAESGGDTNKQYLSIDEIKAEYKKSAECYLEERIIQTTPEKLARVCDEIQQVVSEAGDDSSNMTYDFEKVIQLNGCLKMVTKDYLTKTQILMDIERLQAFEDIKAYDMYSCRFEYLQIPPTRTRVPSCPQCNKFNKELPKSSPQCPHHMIRGYSNYPKSRSKSAKVCTREQVRRLAGVFSQLGKMKGELGKMKGERIIAYLNVPGVAENRPLVSIGDLVRFRFKDIEVIGEVGDIQVKTETIMLFLPIPSRKIPAYYDALMNTKINDEWDNSSQDPNFGRFDVRFGLFGSRAHDIFRTTAFSAISNKFDQVIRVMAPTPFLHEIGKKSIRRPQIGISDWAHTLNSEQKHAVFDIVRKNHGQAPYCIYGPPGTGKTMTVVESVFQLLRHDKTRKILICAPSDAACDVITKRLLPVIKGWLKLKRVNWWSRNPASLPPALLGCSSMDESGFFILPSEEEMKDASIIICQCFVAGCLDLGSINGESWMDGHFTHVFIDESSQSFEFESLVPLMKVNKDCSIILAGDPKQLGPSVRSQCASRNGLSISLQERLMGLSLYQLDTNYSVITKLLDNYRSHDALLSVSSELFYNGSLRCKASIEVTSACEGFELLRDGQNFPLMVYDVNDGIEMHKIDTPSFYNIEECHTVMKIIKALLSSPNVEINTGQIAVITCFRAQVLKLREIFRKNDLGAINVGVVEDFQGQEMSVVLISTVLTSNQERWRNGAKGGLGFMTDPRRFNVAITRASSLCVVVGKVDYLEKSGSYWTALIEHARRNGGISGDSQFITNDEDHSAYYNEDYGITHFIDRVKELNLALGSGHELDRYNMVMNGYYQDAPEWRVCL